MDAETYKRAAAARALDYVRPGMRLGLGTGSTAKHFVDLLGERVRAGLDVIAVPTTLLSNRPGYPTIRGRVLDTQLVADLLLGSVERGFFG